MRFEELRRRHSRFIYEAYDIRQSRNNITIFFNFKITPDIIFRPSLVFPRPPSLTRDALKNLEGLIFNLGMVEAISYWKATCSPKIVIKAGYLNKKQFAWWRKLLIKGLGEFFYTNSVDFTQKDLVEIKVKSDKKFSPFASSLKGRDLILVGGGKDSTVTLEKISRQDRDFNCLMLNPTRAAMNISKAGGCKNSIIVKRTIDPKLLELNSKGYLNGHTPYSAYLAFLSVFCGVLYNYKNLIVSNEASSNEGNVEYHGQIINHQYSKSFEFEKDFRVYCREYLASSANYFSFLRKWGELKISKEFSRMPKYHKLFRSCNQGLKTNSWCGRCAKCVSTCITLSPFLGKKTKEIFGKDLLEDINLMPIVKKLLGENNAVKPFECVATKDEIKTAISLGIKRAKKDREKIPKLLQRFYI